MTTESDSGPPPDQSDNSKKDTDKNDEEQVCENSSTDASEAESQDSSTVEVSDDVDQDSGEQNNSGHHSSDAESESESASPPKARLIVKKARSVDAPPQSDNDQGAQKSPSRPAEESEESEPNKSELGDKPGPKLTRSESEQDSTGTDKGAEANQHEGDMIMSKGDNASAPDDSNLKAEGESGLDAAKISGIGIAAFGLAFVFGVIALVLSARVDVPADKVLIATRLTGSDLEEGQFIALDTGTKGVELTPYNEGLHWFNPYTYTTEIADTTYINGDEVGVLVRLFGKDLPGNSIVATPGYGEEIASPKSVFKGVIAEPLKPGKWNVNTRAYRVERFNSTKVPPGFVGVSIRMTGDVPTGEAANSYVNDDPKLKGVSSKTLAPKTYYLNPYVEQVVLVSTRDQRFDFTNEDNKRREIVFQSSDAFNLKMQGIVQWSIDSQKAPELVCRLGEFRNMDWAWTAPVSVSSMESKSRKRRSKSRARRQSSVQSRYKGPPVLDTNLVVDNVLTPFIRSFIRILGAKYRASEYISGERRMEIQKDFRAQLTEKCEAFGITIKNVSITSIKPPETIKNIINNRSFQREQRNRITQNIEKLRSDAKLQKKQESIRKSQLEVDAKTRAEKAKIRARQNRNVALKKVESELLVAKVNLNKAKTEKERYVIDERAKIDQDYKKRAAEIEALRLEIEANGGGENYIRSIFVRKLGQGLGTIVTNDNSLFMEVFEDILNLRKAREPRAKVYSQPAGPEKPGLEGESKAKTENGGN